MQGIYPYVSQKAMASQERAIVFLRKVTLLMGAGNLVISGILLLFTEQIVKLLLGGAYGTSILLLRIMAFLPLLIGFSQIFGIQVMMNFGMQKKFTRILIFASILNLILVCPFIYFFQATGVAIVVTVTEFFVTYSMYRTIRNSGIFLF